MAQKLSRIMDIEPILNGARYGTVASIYFKTDGARLDEQDINVIREACEVIKNLTGMREFSGCLAELHVRGFADFRGADHHNFLLGKARADAVRAQVRKMVGVKVVSVSLGEDFGAQQRGKDKLSAELLAEDRRVDIVLALQSMAQVSSRGELRELKDELQKLNDMLLNSKSFEASRKLGPLAYYVPSDKTLDRFKNSVNPLLRKGLTDKSRRIFRRPHSTVGQSLSDSLMEVGEQFAKLPGVIGNIIWIYYSAPSEDFVDTSVQLFELVSGSAPEGAVMSKGEIEQIRVRMTRIKALLDETTKCQVTRSP